MRQNNPLKLQTLDLAYTIGALSLWALRARNPTIFVMGTMRSGSTLLSHLLFTNPHIIGVGEAWRIYRSPLDLNRTTVKLLAMRRCPYRRDHLFQDTLLHDHLLPDPNLLLHQRVLPMFLIREPGAVLRSLFRAQISGCQTWPEIESYYRNRQQTLVRYGNSLRGKKAFFLIRYDELVKDTIPTLAAAQHFLHLDSPFSCTYPIFEFTGRRTGDQSVFIREGQVVNERPAVPVDLPKDLLAKCQVEHEDLVKLLTI